LTGIAAIATGVAVIASGVALAPMIAIALITIVAGTLTLNNGIADVSGSITGFNYMRDGVFKGNTSAYSWYSGISEGIAIVGTIVCGGWLRYNQPRINAYKSLNTYNVKTKHLPGAGGSWSKFNSSNQAYLRNVGQNAIKNTPMRNLLYNSPDSYKLIYDTGSIIGTTGQSSIRLVFSKVGQIITYFPQ
jgi:hypothetical protein